MNFLKAHIIQLDRQLLLLNDALGARMSCVLEAENALQDIIDMCKYASHRVPLDPNTIMLYAVLMYLQSFVHFLFLRNCQSTGDVRAGGVFVPTHALKSIVERAESARVRLYKNVEVSDVLIRSL